MIKKHLAKIAKEKEAAASTDHAPKHKSRAASVSYQTRESFQMSDVHQAAVAQNFALAQQAQHFALVQQAQHFALVQQAQHFALAQPIGLFYQAQYIPVPPKSGNEKAPQPIRSIEDEQQIRAHQKAMFGNGPKPTITDLD
jgi:hypothetical protein